MKFYRRATYQDLDSLTSWYEKYLSPQARELIKKESHKAMSFVKNEKYCSLQEAKVIVDDYGKFLKVLQDFSDGKEIYTDY